MASLPLPEKQAFDLLMSVQHVGAKLALAVLSVLSPRDLAAAITHEDVERLDAVPGAGAKVAERIVRELRDKTGGLNLSVPERMIAASANGHANAISLVDDRSRHCSTSATNLQRRSVRLIRLMALTIRMAWKP